MALLGVAKIGISTASGIITGPGATKVFIEGVKCSVHGDAVASHGSGSHSAATITGTTTTKVFVEGKKIVRQNDTASCGHAVAGTSTKVLAG